MSQQLQFLCENLPNLLIGFPGNRPGGLCLSIFLALIGVGIGFLIAILFAALSDTRKAMVRWFVHCYVDLLRGLPLVLLLLLIHQIVGGRWFGQNLTPRTSAVIALALYSSAYQIEILRAGLRSVPKQLIESARVLGASPQQIYLRIQLRHAIRVMTPALVGQAISLFKDTSVVIIISVAELMTVAHIALGSDVTNAPYWVPLYVLVGLLYFAVAFGLSYGVQRWTQRRQSTDLMHSLVNY